MATLEAYPRTALYDPWILPPHYLSDESGP